MYKKDALWRWMSDRIINSLGTNCRSNFLTESILLFSRMSTRQALEEFSKWKIPTTSWEEIQISRERIKQLVDHKHEMGY